MHDVMSVQARCAVVIALLVQVLNQVADGAIDDKI